MSKLRMNKNFANVYTPFHDIEKLGTELDVNVVQNIDNSTDKQ